MDIRRLGGFRSADVCSDWELKTRHLLRRDALWGGWRLFVGPAHASPVSICLPVWCRYVTIVRPARPIDFFYCRSSEPLMN